MPISPNPRPVFPIKCKNVNNVNEKLVSKSSQIFIRNIAIQFNKTRGKSRLFDRWHFIFLLYKGQVYSKFVIFWVNCVDLIKDYGIVCLMYQEIELSWDCVFIVSGDRAILGMCVYCIRRQSYHMIVFIVLGDRAILGMCVCCIRRQNQHGIVCLLYQEIELSWVCVFVVSRDRTILFMCVYCTRITILGMCDYCMKR